MSAELFRRAEAALEQVLAAPARSRRAALEEACRGDAALRREVDSLLAHAEAMTGFLAAPALGSEFALPGMAPAASEWRDDLLDATLGPHRVVKRLASGGMGTVYEGRRADESFEQRVAIKVVKRGMDSEEILRRFRAERQTLAGLDHPNIARLLDAGLTPDGRPYLVMEYVEGVPIDTYCDNRRLSTLDRLALFRTVCEAVRYAHASLVVHRDLKPGNILVTPEGVPKLLDFGIARVLSRRRDDLTSPEERRLTPEYASPEQIRGQSVTTASDVYSLGVILFELLTGHRPYRFETREPGEIERVVLGTDPPAPSTTIFRVESRPGVDGAAPTTITPALVSQTREASPDRLRRRLKGELDTIVLAALRKEPERRYPSAEALGGDIDRFLRGLPVLAHKDTLGYRVSKFVRRYPAGVTLACVLAVSLVGGAAATGVQAKRIARERDDAYYARDQAEAIVYFLQNALRSADPARLGPDTTLKEVLDAASLQLEAEFKDRPLVGAAVHGALGRTYTSLGEFEHAEEHLRRALEVRQRTLDVGHHDVAESNMDLAALLHATNRLSEAEELLRRALDVHMALRGMENPDTARVYNDLGGVLRVQGQFDEAERMHTRALDIRRSAFGPSSLQVAESLNNLIATARGRGDLAAAESYARQALEIRRAELRDDHPLVAQAVQNLGVVLSLRDAPDAEAVLRESVDTHRAAFPTKHPQVAFALNSLAGHLSKQKRYADAEPLFAEAYAIRAEKLSPSDPSVASTEVSWGRCLAVLGRHEDARRVLRHALERLRRPGSELAARWKPALEDLAGACEALGDGEGAAAARREIELLE